RRDHVGFPLRLFDMLRGTQYVLVTYLAGPHAADDASKIEALSTALQSRHGDTMRVMAIAEPSATMGEPIGYALLRDAEGAFASAYGASAGMTLLVRPDGYIGLLCDAPEAEVIEAFLRQAGE